MTQPFEYWKALSENDPLEDSNTPFEIIDDWEKERGDLLLVILEKEKKEEAIRNSLDDLLRLIQDHGSPSMKSHATILNQARALVRFNQKGDKPW